MGFFPATVIYSPVQIKTQELNVIGILENFSVETNVLEFITLVIVAMTVLLTTKPWIITVAKNPTPPVKPGLETFNVKDKYWTGISHVMDLVHKKQNLETPCYPVMTKRNVM